MLFITPFVVCCFLFTVYCLACQPLHPSPQSSSLLQQYHLQPLPICQWQESQLSTQDHHNNVHHDDEKLTQQSIIFCLHRVTLYSLHTSRIPKSNHPTNNNCTNVPPIPIIESPNKALSTVIISNGQNITINRV